MQGLVDYGSDSDDDAPVPTSRDIPSSQTSLLSSLPAPKSKLTMALPPPTSSSSSTSLPVPTPKPAKKGKGPVRIMLDLPPPSASTNAASGDDDDEADAPPMKRAKLSLGANGKPLSGLAAMLPAPKNESVAVKLEKALAPSVPVSRGKYGEEQGETTVPSSSTGFVPHRVGKKKAAAAAAAPAPEMDFFGLGSMAFTAAPTASTSTLKPMTISSAPVLSAPPTTSSSTSDDPYPGYTQLASGQWVAKDKEAYERWMAALANDAANAGPAGFEANEMAKTGVVDVDVQALRDKWALEKKNENPSKVVADDKPKVPAKAVNRAAKGKHQLSTLLADARDNRAELEERIAQARANRKGAGQKYGF